MLKRAAAVDHILTNLEVMSSETSIWNMMDALESNGRNEIYNHASEHGFEVVPETVMQMWQRKTKPEDIFVLKTMATMQKEEVDTPGNAA